MRNNALSNTYYHDSICLLRLHNSTVSKGRWVITHGIYVYLRHFLVLSSCINGMYGVICSLCMSIAFYCFVNGTVDVSLK